MAFEYFTENRSICFNSTVNHAKAIAIQTKCTSIINNLVTYIYISVHKVIYNGSTLDQSHPDCKNCGQKVKMAMCKKIIIFSG